jgi:hypothetical protein
MSAMRETNQADWDLERCFEMFDEALISKDERVVNALRNLLMIVTLTAPETELSGIESRQGPLRRIMDDINSLTRHINNMDDELRSLKRAVMPRDVLKENEIELDFNHTKYWNTSGPSHGGGLGITTPIAVGHFASAQEIPVQNKIRGLLDNEC